MIQQLKKILSKQTDLLNNLKSHTEIGYLHGNKIGGGNIPIEQFKTLQKLDQNLIEFREKISRLRDQNIIVLQKNFAYNCLNSLGYIMLSKVSKEGKTYVLGEDYRKALKTLAPVKVRSNILSFIVFTALIMIFFGKYFSMKQIFALFIFGSFFGYVFTKLFFKLFEKMGGYTYRKKEIAKVVKEYGNAKLNELLFTKGRDFKSDAASFDTEVIQVLYPKVDNSKMELTLSLIDSMKDNYEGPNKEVLITVAISKNCLGVENRRFVIPPTERADYCICLEVDDLLIIFPYSLSYHKETQKADSEILNELFETNPYKLFEI